MHRILIFAIAVLALPAAALAGSDADTNRAALDKWEAAYNSGGDAADIAGKYIVVRKKGGDDGWLLHRDIWNAGQ